MRLDDIQIELKPRDKWRATDIGFLLARRWYWSLLKIWLAMTALPFLVLVILFPEHALLISVALWWLLPFFERPLIFAASQALFNDMPPLWESVKAFPSLAKRHMWSWLTFYRLWSARAFVQPIFLLENIDGDRYRKRRAQLLLGVDSGPFWLIVVCAHLVAFLYYGLYVLAYFLAPDTIPHNWEFVDEIPANEIFDKVSDLLHTDTKSELISLMAYYFSVSVITPFFVVAGFSLYIHRRIWLEGWDIELQFKRLGEAAKHQSVVLTFIITSFMCFGATDSMALEHPSKSSDPELTAKQQVVSEEITALAESLKSQGQQTIASWELKPEYQKEKTSDEDAPDFGFDSAWLAPLAFILEASLWLIAIATLIYLLPKLYQAFKQSTFVKKKESLVNTDVQITGKQTHEEPLSINIEAVITLFEQAKWREGLVLWWQVIRIEMTKQFQTILPKGATEKECINAWQSHLADNGKLALIQAIGRNKEQVVYAKQLPNTDKIAALVEQWKELFS